MSYFWSIGNKPMVAKVITDDTTLKNRDFRAESLITCAVAAKTITFPTPCNDNLGYILRFANSSEGNLTLSCTDKIFPAASTWVIATGGQAEAVCARTAASTYRWLVRDLTTDSSAPQPVASTFTPTLAWTTHTPTVSAGVYRKLVFGGGVACLNMDITITDGKDSTGLSCTFPTGLVPDDVDQLVVCHAQVSVDGAAYTNVVAQLNAAHNTAGNRVLTVTTGTLTDTKACKVLIKVGPYEV